MRKEFHRSCYHVTNACSHVTDKSNQLDNYSFRGYLNEFLIFFALSSMSRRNRVSDTDRMRIITAYENNQDYVALADSLSINRDTARSIVRVWMTEGGVERRPQGGARNVRMDREMINALLEIAREEPFTTLTTIKEKLEQRFPEKPTVHISTISRHLKDQLISLKIAGKDADVPYRRNIATTKDNRFNYVTWLTTLSVNDNIIYVDECAINLFTRRTQGRAPIGQPVRQQVIGARMANINLIMAINADLGLVHFDVRQQTITHSRYQEFIDHLVNVEAATRFQGTIHIVHDGARPHLNTTAPQQHAHRVSIRTLPPYSPFLNPVEQAHSCFKAAISRSLTTAAIQQELINDSLRQREGLTQAAWRAGILLRIANHALADVTPTKCSNWCRRVHRFIPPSLNRQDIVG